MEDYTKPMRLQKFLSHAGLGSRRSIEKSIDKGMVTVNGQTVTRQGVKVNPTKDTVTFQGKTVTLKPQKFYYWLNKPVGVVSTTKDNQGSTTVLDFLPPKNRLYPVGRLDKDSQGLLLLTNDGGLTHRLTHPRYHLVKTYKVLVAGKVTSKKLKQLRGGIELEPGTVTAPAEVEVIAQEDKDKTWLKVKLGEGKFRQIRRMAAHVDLHVLQLIRTAYGPISLAGLKEGRVRPATEVEINLLKKLVGLSSPASAGPSAPGTPATKPPKPSR